MRTMTGAATAFPPGTWGVILGGSSGFGLAAAHKLAEHGMNLCLVHRDRRGSMHRIEPEFEALRAHGVELLTANANALDAGVRDEILAHLAEAMGGGGRVRVLLHSIAFGNLKLIAPEPPRDGTRETTRALADALGVSADDLAAQVESLFTGGHDRLHSIAAAPAYSRQLLEEEDLAQTIHAMGISLLGWTRALHDRGLFAHDARVLALTSEGNEVAWRGYAAVSAAKVALEAISRALAVELAPYGVRSNVIQAGVTDTAALRAIPGHERLRAQALLRNPFRRLTTPRDVANAVYLLSTDEAGWINGGLLRVDGGEHVAGLGS
jgi:NAD(P)-dependent dehydrogenase (short-subunit alcohol dehydrogenase family)